MVRHETDQAPEAPAYGRTPALAALVLVSAGVIYTLDDGSTRPPRWNSPPPSAER